MTPSPFRYYVAQASADRGEHESWQNDIARHDDAAHKSAGDWCKRCEIHRAAKGGLCPVCADDAKKPAPPSIRDEREAGIA